MGGLNPHQPPSNRPLNVDALRRTRLLLGWVKLGFQPTQRKERKGRYGTARENDNDVMAYCRRPITAVSDDDVSYMPLASCQAVADTP